MSYKTLDHMPDHQEETLTAHLIAERLGPANPFGAICFFSTIDSTNTVARRVHQSGLEIAESECIRLSDHKSSPMLFVADDQTAGRGRMGRQWIAEKGANLLFSILCYPTIEPLMLGALPLCIAVSVAEAIEACIGLEVRTKWPNDLLIHGKKVCGILMESILSADGSVVLIVGIGVNVNQRKFPPDIPAGSLAQLSGGDHSRLKLLVELLERHSWLLGKTAFENPKITPTVVSGFLDRWRERSSILGRELRIDTGQGIVSGRAIDIANDGALILDVEGSLRRIVAGDVTILDGYISSG